MEHSSIDYAVTFTCHKCQEKTEQRTIEWPPEIFVCGNCSSVFALAKQTTEGEVEMKLTRYDI